jgi:hypothetical protein
MRSENIHIRYDLMRRATASIGRRASLATSSCRFPAHTARPLDVAGGLLQKEQQNGECFLLELLVLSVQG